MKVLVPNHLWPEVDSLTQHDAEVLYDEAIKLLREADSAEEVATAMTANGFSPEFSVWYATNVEKSRLNDSTLILIAPPGPASERLANSRFMWTVAGVLLALVVPTCLSILPSRDIAVDLRFASLFLVPIGGYCVARAKNRGAEAALALVCLPLLGVIILLLLPDQRPLQESR